MPMTNPEVLYAMPLESRLHYAKVSIFTKYLVKDPNKLVRDTARNSIAAKTHKE